MKRILLLVFFAACFAAWTGHAGADQSTLEEAMRLDEQQAALSDRLNRIDAVGHAHGRYVLLRDTYFAGANGVKEQSTQWFAAAQSWVRAWYELLAMVERSPDLSRVEVQDAVRERLRTQQKNWLALKAQGDKIRARSTDGLVKVDAIPSFDEAYVQGYGAQLTVLNGSVSNLREALKDGSFAFDASARASWDQVTLETERLVILKLKAALLKYPELSAALAKVEQAFRAEREIEPLVKKVNDSYNELRDHLLSGRVFHAEDAVNALERDGNAALQTIRASGLDPELTFHADETIANWIATGKRSFRDVAGPLPRAALVKRYFARESRLLAARCRDVARRKEVDCDLLRSLVVIPAASLDTMTDVQLRYFEEQLGRVQAGPLR